MMIELCSGTWLATFWEGLQCALCSMTICILVVSLFGYKGGTVVLIAPVSGICLPFNPASPLITEFNIKR